MAIIYKVKQASKANKEGKKLYHPSTVHIGLVTTAQMAKEVAEYSSLTAGDVKNTIDNLITVMQKHLASSEVVELDGIGTFRIRLKSQGKGVENPDEVSPKQAVPKLYFHRAAERNITRSTSLWGLLGRMEYKSIKQLRGSKSVLVIPDPEPDTDGEENGDTDHGV